MGERGLLLAFVSDVWMPGSVQLLRWLQRLSLPLLHDGIRTVLLAANSPHTLKGYHVSSPVPPLFTLLSDSDGSLRQRFMLGRGDHLLLIDTRRRILLRWLVSGAAVPRPKSFMRAVRAALPPA